MLRRFPCPKIGSYRASRWKKFVPWLVKLVGNFSKFGESSRGNTIRGNRTESLWEEICLWEGLWEDLWKPLKNLWEPLKKTLKTSQNLWKPLKTSKNLSKPLKNLSKPSLSETLSETLSEADFLSEALNPVAPILLPLKLSLINSLHPLSLEIEGRTSAKLFARMSPHLSVKHFAWSSLSGLLCTIFVSVPSWPKLLQDNSPEQLFL